MVRALPEWVPWRLAWSRAPPPVGSRGAWHGPRHPRVGPLAPGMMPVLGDARASFPAPPLERFAELIVGFGANVQPGQVVAIGTEPGKERLTRALATAAYRRGAKFVDVA